LLQTFALKILEGFVNEARNHGCIALGFSRPIRPIYWKQFESWLADSSHGQMSWLTRNKEVRKEPRHLLHGCKTIISLAFPYSQEKPVTTDGFEVARYSQPDQADYHEALKQQCLGLVGFLNQFFQGMKSRICIDSAPLLERSIAFTSGMGFFGKNNMLIIPDYGSYFFLAEILIDTEMPIPSFETLESACGSCTRCMEACPTGALERPFYLNASRCLSYLTVEYRDALPRDTGRKMGRCFFGCDRCQEVCPFNDSRSQLRKTLLPSVKAILAMDKAEFDDKFRRTAFRRAGLEKLKTNILAMLKESRGSA
jgi:epoxyqueuosine reductase